MSARSSIERRLLCASFNDGSNELANSVAAPYAAALPTTRPQNWRLADTGEIVEVDPPKRLVLKMVRRARNEFRPGLESKGYSRCTIESRADGRCREADHHQM
jgi:hypothetical protein